jgi:hypothetical protein
MTNDTPNPPTAWLPLLREVMAGAIALFVVAVFAWLLFRAVTSGSNAPDVTLAKELLGMVNPLMGLVVGYYFSRVTSEARAERAEATVTATLRSAERASEARDQAVSDARTARERAGELTHALEGLTRAAEQALAPRGAAQETVRAADRPSDLESALERARRALR